MTRSHWHAAILASVAALLGSATVARASATPIGSLPRGPVVATTTTVGQLVAVALPHSHAGEGFVWRIARRYDAKVVREVSEADVGAGVVVIYKVVGRGNTSLVFALTRGDTSPKAVQSYRHTIHAR